MKTFIIFVGENIQSAANFTSEYLECNCTTDYSCSTDHLISKTEKDHLTKYLDKVYSTSPIFVEATEEEIDNVGNSLTLIIKK